MIYFTFFSFLKESKFRSVFSAVLFGALTTMGIVYYHIFIIVKKHQAARLLYKQSGSMHFNKPNQVQLAYINMLLLLMIILFRTIISKHRYADKRNRNKVKMKKLYTQH